jgi:hypothetical protein
MAAFLLALALPAATPAESLARRNTPAASPCPTDGTAAALSGEEKLEIAAQIAFHSIQTQRLGAPTGGMRRALVGVAVEQEGGGRVSGVH